MTVSAPAARRTAPSPDAVRECERVLLRLLREQNPDVDVVFSYDEPASDVERDSR